MAGMESTANTTSVVSMRTSTAKQRRGQEPAGVRVNSFWPSYSRVEGTTSPYELEHRVVLGVDLAGVVPSHLRPP
jgi:hypothetical protein